MYKIFTESKFRWHNHARLKLIRIMKLTCALIMLVIIQVSAKTYAQKINIEVQKAPLEDVLYTLQQQSGYDFIYSSPLIKTAAPVSLSLKNVSIVQALDKIFTGQPLVYLIAKKT